MTELEGHRIESLPITGLTDEIIGANVGNNTVVTTDLPALIATVGWELASLGQATAEPDDEKLKPAVPSSRSVRPDDIVCLVYGKPQKMLKCHLATRHELTPDAHRAMFGLMDVCLLVASSYAADALGDSQKERTRPKARGNETGKRGVQ